MSLELFEVPKVFLSDFILVVSSVVLIVSYYRFKQSNTGPVRYVVAKRTLSASCTSFSLLTCMYNSNCVKNPRIFERVPLNGSGGLVFTDLACSRPSRWATVSCNWSICQVPVPVMEEEFVGLRHSNLHPCCSTYLLFLLFQVTIRLYLCTDWQILCHDPHCLVPIHTFF